MGLIGNPGLANNPTANDCMHVAQTFRSMGIWAYQTWQDSLWKNRYGLSIPQSFAALGTAYAAMKTDMDLLGAVLSEEGCNLPAMPAGWSVTQNADGSATPTQTTS